MGHRAGSGFTCDGRSRGNEGRNECQLREMWEAISDWDTCLNNGYKKAFWCEESKKKRGRRGKKRLRRSGKRTDDCSLGAFYEGEHSWTEELKCIDHSWDS